MANIANVKVKQGNLLELSGSSVSISGSQGLNLHTQDGGISANAGKGNIVLTSDGGMIKLDTGLNGAVPSGSLQITASVGVKGDLVVSGAITAHTLNIVETVVTSSVVQRDGATRFGDTTGRFGTGDLHQFSGSVSITDELKAASLTGSIHYNQLDQIGAGKVVVGTTGGTPELRELSGSSGISVSLGTEGKIVISAGDETEFVTTGGEQSITGHKTFNSLSVTGSGGLTLTSAAPLVASGSVTVTGSALTLLADAPLVASGSVSITGSSGLLLTADSKLVNSGSTTLLGSLTLADGSSITSDGATLAKSVSLTGLLNLATGATGSQANVAANSVVLALDNSEVELPAVSDGKLIIIKKSDGGTLGVRVLASGSQTIDGVANADGPFYLYGPYQSVHLIGSGSGWFVL